MFDDLERALAAARPELDPTPQVTAAARRAVLDTPGNRRRGRRIAGLALAAALLAWPAYAIGSHIIDFSSQARAPSVVQKRFEVLFRSGAPPKMDPQVIPEETRRVTVFHVAGRKYPLWVAPTRTGGLCEEIVGFAGGCIADRDFPGILVPPPPEYRPWLLDVTVGGTNDFSLLGGVVTARGAARLELHYSDGGARPVDLLWVSQPIDAGFFLLELPPVDAEVQPVALKLFDEDGKLLAETHQVRLPPGPRGA